MLVYDCSNITMINGEFIDNISTGWGSTGGFSIEQTTGVDL